MSDLYFLLQHRKIAQIEYEYRTRAAWKENENNFFEKKGSNNPTICSLSFILQTMERPTMVNYVYNFYVLNQFCLADVYLMWNRKWQIYIY